MRVLVADPSATFVQGAGQALEAAGHEVVLAVNGLEAWRAVQASAVQAAFVSASMPDIDGLALASLWNHDGAHARPAVVLMADAREAADLRLWARLIGSSEPPELLTRPISPRLLVDVAAAVAHGA